MIHRKYKILSLTRYGSLGASSRLRFFQYYPFLESYGFEITSSTFFDNNSLASRYKNGKYSFNQLYLSYSHRFNILSTRHRFDLLWIEKEALPWIPWWAELFLTRGVPYVLDYDDAWFHKYDQHRYLFVRSLFGDRLDQLMKYSSLVIAGNEYLSNRAISAGASSVTNVPTVVDLRRYPMVCSPLLVSSDEPLRIVWMGSPSTVKYLHLIENALRILSSITPFVLRVVGANINIPDVCVESLSWSEDSESRFISQCDIGIMPLSDSDWERGKCGYKLIQYMACSLPVVASPVGPNSDIVGDGVCGFLAGCHEQWVEFLGRLLRSPELRTSMGRQGRLRVESTYCMQVTAPILAKQLSQALGKPMT